MKLYEIQVIKDDEFIDQTVWEVDGRGERNNTLPVHLFTFARDRAKALGGNAVRVNRISLGRVYKGGFAPQLGELVYESVV